MASIAPLQTPESAWLPELPVSALAHIPGEKGWPLVGSTFEQLANPIAYTAKRVKQYGPVYRNYSFGGWTISLIGADANELVLFDRDKLFSSEQGWGPLLNLLFPRGLMLLDFDEHRVHRRALSAAFKPEPMTLYANALNEGIHARIKQWSGTSFKFYTEIKRLTLELAATSFLGIPWGPEADRINHAFIDMVAASVGVIRKPLPGTLMAKGVAGRRYMSAFFAREIPARRQGTAEDIFSQLCRTTYENGDLLSDQDIIDHMNFLMMAAHDTLTSSMSSTIMMLGKNPEWQERLRAEFLSLGVNGEALPYERLNDLPLTECVFKEALRLNAPVPSLPRRALRDFRFGGYDIPAGTHVGISPMYTHLMPELWGEDAARFNPLRFTPENSRTRHKYAWVPFGGGAHMCLGLHFAYMQSKIFLFHLLSEHKVVIDPSYRDDWQIFPMPKPRDGLPVRIERI